MASLEYLVKTARDEIKSAERGEVLYEKERGSIEGQKFGGRVFIRSRRFAVGNLIDDRGSSPEQER